jgi:hypothetical protein
MNYFGRETKSGFSRPLIAVNRPVDTMLACKDFFQPNQEPILPGLPDFWFENKPSGNPESYDRELQRQRCKKLQRL